MSRRKSNKTPDAYYSCRLPENTFFVSAQHIINKLLEHEHSEPFEKPLDPSENSEAYAKLDQYMGTFTAISVV